MGVIEQSHINQIDAEAFLPNELAEVLQLQLSVHALSRSSCAHQNKAEALFPNELAEVLCLSVRQLTC